MFYCCYCCKVVLLFLILLLSDDIDWDWDWEGVKLFYNKSYKFFELFRLLLRLFLLKLLKLFSSFIKIFLLLFDLPLSFFRLFVLPALLVWFIEIFLLFTFLLSVFEFTPWLLLSGAILAQTNILSFSYIANFTNI
jgi:hypothetical protein